MENSKATVSLFLDTRREKKDGLYPVKLTVYFEGDKKRYSTAIDVTETDWEKLNKANLRDNDLKTLRIKLNKKKDAAQNILDKIEPFSFQEFEEYFFQEKRLHKSLYIKDLFQEYIAELEKKGRVGSVSLYTTTINSLLDYKPGLKVTDITKKFLEDYEVHMLSKEHASSVPKKFANKMKKKLSGKKKGISPTTIGIYMRQLRSIVNRAIADRRMPAEKYPFKGYTIPSARNVKKALIAPQVRKLLDYKSEDLAVQRAIDFWLFSYISNGMNFTDICYLRPENIQRNFFSFLRAKTKNTRKRDKRPIKVPLTPETKAIIERWKNIDPSNPYLFSILQVGLTPRQEKYRIQDFISKVNKAMNRIADELGFEGRLGTYVARHSHSTILKRSGASTEMIKENLGHASVLTTENYLDDFEDDVKMEYAKKLTDL